MVDEDTNHNPSEKIKIRYDLLHKDRKLIFLIHDSSSNHNPSVDFNRQASAHHPAILRPKEWETEINHCNQVVLIRVRLLECLAVYTVGKKSLN